MNKYIELTNEEIKELEETCDLTSLKKCGTLKAKVSSYNSKKGKKHDTVWLDIVSIPLTADNDFDV